MKRYSLIPFLTCFSFSLFAQDPAMKQAKEDAKKIAKENLSTLQKNLLNDNMGISDQDFLPEEDKGKTFDGKEADSAFKHAASHTEANELNQFVQSTKKREQLDDNEEFLVKGHQITQNPSSKLDISSIETFSTSEEENIVTCQEGGTYQRSIKQTLLVQPSPDEKLSIKKCLGHAKTTNYDTEKKAKHNVSLKKEAFKENSEIQAFEVHRDETKVTSIWTHKDNIASCDHFLTEDKVVQVGAETDVWQTEEAEILTSIESIPSCKLLYTTVLKGPETRLIHGKSIYREVWERKHHFSCEADSNSKCAQLRTQGAVFMSKQCLQRNVFDECDLWEKTYDLGKKAASQQTKVAFNKDALWGLNNEFDNSYEKNTDFGQVLTTLSVFADLEHTLEEQSTDFNEEVQIFKGENLKCEKSFMAGYVFDCCKDMEGLAVDVKLASCKSEEKCLAKYRHDGKCHFIGTQKAKLGTVTEHVYCCFPSKIARVIHEQGRTQLKIKWGKADSPKCRGFSLEELQKINFSSIDLSEVIADVKVDKQAFAKKLKNSVEPLQAKVQAEIEKKRLKSLDEQHSIEEITSE